MKLLRWDDATHLLGLLCLLAQVAAVTADTSMIYEDPDNAIERLTEQNRLKLFLRLDTAAIMLSWCCLYAIKATFLLLYHQIFRVSQGFMRAWWITSIIVFATFWVLFAGTLTKCGSVADLVDIGRLSRSEWKSLTGKLTLRRQMQRTIGTSKPITFRHLYLRSKRPHRRCHYGPPPLHAPRPSYEHQSKSRPRRHLRCWHHHDRLRPGALDRNPHQWGPGLHCAMDELGISGCRYCVLLTKPQSNDGTNQDRQCCKAYKCLWAAVVAAGGTEQSLQVLRRFINVQRWNPELCGGVATSGLDW